MKLKKTVNTSDKYVSNVVELQENMQPFVRKLLLQLLFLVSAGISRSFDSAMLVTTQSTCTKYLRCSWLFNFHGKTQTVQKQVQHRDSIM